MVETPGERLRRERAAQAPPPPPPGGGGFDPSQHTVTEVLDYVATHPTERGDVTDREAAGKARSTLLAALDSLEESGD